MTGAPIAVSKSLSLESQVDLAVSLVTLVRTESWGEVFVEEGFLRSLLTLGEETLLMRGRVAGAGRFCADGFVASFSSSEL